MSVIGVMCQPNDATDSDGSMEDGLPSIMIHPQADSGSETSLDSWPSSENLTVNSNTITLRFPELETGTVGYEEEPPDVYLRQPQHQENTSQPQPASFSAIAEETTGMATPTEESGFKPARVKKRTYFKRLFFGYIFAMLICFLVSLGILVFFVSESFTFISFATLATFNSLISTTTRHVIGGDHRLIIYNRPARHNRQ